MKENKPWYELKRERKKEEVLKMLQKEVFDEPEYERHLREVAETENLPLDVVGVVMEDYITKIALFMIQPFKIKRRITLSGFMNIEVLASIYNWRSSNYINYKDKIKKK